MPPRWTNGPFALFILAKLDVEIINEILAEAQSYPGLNVPQFWPATLEYRDAPQKQANEANPGTAPPIPSSFNCPFVGQKLEAVAKWLREKPDSVDLDGHHFGVLDRVSGKDKSIIACKIGDKDLKGDQLDFRRYSAVDASLLLQGHEYGDWEEAHKKPTDTKIEYGDSS